MADEVAPGTAMEASQATRTSSRIRKRTEKTDQELENDGAQGTSKETLEKALGGELVRKPRTDKRKKKAAAPGEEEREEAEFQTAVKGNAEGEEAGGAAPEIEEEGQRVKKKLWADETPDAENTDMETSKSGGKAAPVGAEKEVEKEGGGEEEQQEPEEEPEPVRIPFTPQTGARFEALMAGPIHLLGKEQKELMKQAEALGIPILRDVDTTELRTAGGVKWLYVCFGAGGRHDVFGSHWEIKVGKMMELQLHYCCGNESYAEDCHFTLRIDSFYCLSLLSNMEPCCATEF